MRKRLVVLWVALLCACGLLLPACGGGAGGTGAPAVDPAKKFVGTWQLAAIRSEGVTIVGDFSSVLGSNQTLVLELAEGGTGTITVKGEEMPCTWELSGDDTISVKPDEAVETDDESSLIVFAADAAELTFADDALTGSWDDDGQVREAIFTVSGSLPDEPTIDPTQAEAFSSLDEIVGTWNLTSMKADQAVMYGSPEALAAMNEDMDSTFVIAEDGSATFMGQTCTCKMTDNGAAIDLVFFQIPLKSYDGGMLIDMSDFFGTDMVFCFTK